MNSVNIQLLCHDQAQIENVHKQIKDEFKAMHEQLRKKEEALHAELAEVEAAVDMAGTEEKMKELTETEDKIPEDCVSVIQVMFRLEITVVLLM